VNPVVVELARADTFLMFAMKAVNADACIGVRRSGGWVWHAAHWQQHSTLTPEG
jgi:hypothetical protein